MFTTYKETFYKIKKKDKRLQEIPEERGCKRQRVEEIPRKRVERKERVEVVKKREQKKRMTSRKDNKEDLDSGERLRGWLEAYGLNNKTRNVNGAERHVERLRGTQREKAVIEKGGFKFTFKPVERKTTEQVEEMRTIEIEKKKLREETYRELSRGGGSPYPPTEYTTEQSITDREEIAQRKSEAENIEETLTGMTIKKGEERGNPRKTIHRHKTTENDEEIWGIK